MIVLVFASVATLVIWSVRPSGRPRRPAVGSGRLRIGSIGARWWLAGSAASGLALVAPLLGVVLVATVLIRYAGSSRRARRARVGAIERTLPDVIELLAAVVEAGTPVRRAIAMVAERSPGPHRRAWREAARRIERGQSLDEALERLGGELGESVGPVAAAVLAAETDGVALGPALERCGAEAQRLRRLRAEESARRIPVLMLFPLVGCVLPAFVLLTVVPLVAGSLVDLDIALGGLSP